jgi:hypothetical protein
MTLAACGGSGSSPGTSKLPALQSQAAAKQAEARTLGTDTPCTQNNQCSILVFASTAPGCQTSISDADDKIYSLVSSTANQAKTATDQYNAIAGEIQKIYRDSSGSYACLAVAPVLPSAICVSNQCQKK